MKNLTAPSIPGVVEELLPERRRLEFGHFPFRKAEFN
jgi:hypothetical protein